MALVRPKPRIHILVVEEGQYGREEKYSYSCEFEEVSHSDPTPSVVRFSPVPMPQSGVLRIEIGLDDLTEAIEEIKRRYDES